MAELRVVATAGHVDHGKSSLIVRLTGIDPDRWAEEKRRGLTIDLGYAWCTLPSGREIGFVDVPGHERFIANMLAGVGPVRLVLFVVAANEGWGRQSEEHLAILDVLGVAGGVVAITKIDLVDEETLDLAEAEVRERLDGTALAPAPIVPVSSETRQGIDELRSTLDAMLEAAPSPEDARARLFVDRAFTIAGAGTVATGTLDGGCLSVGDEVELYPIGRTARIRSLQTHKRSEERACPVSRVAANLVGVGRAELGRGDVLGRPGGWRPTSVFEGTFRPVRSLGHDVSARGAFTVHAGAADVEARLRILGDGGTRDGQAFVRIRLAKPLVLDVFDRYVLRESGRMETVGGGTVLDIGPPRRVGAAPETRLARRAAAARSDLPRILADERGAVRASEATLLTGEIPAHADVGGWLLREGVLEDAERTVLAHLRAHHDAHPRSEGASAASVRAATGRAVAPFTADLDLADALLDRFAADGVIERTATAIRLPTHGGPAPDDDPDVQRLLAALNGADDVQPPTIPDLVGAGIGRDVIDAAIRAGLVVRVSPDLVFLPRAIERAEGVVGSATDGITVSAFREALGTTRKYALPILAWFDQRGLTRRRGDVRFPRS